ncbi:Threonine synthase and cysteate synthase [Halanaeroarchaeum sp. HSR-CO]|uniref:pyridoxal-phosphate dependent enzyme n=1 Tax=Halanaeroarchaeum sp. HSR-CO TaxID=2866382 RepID=UPI00217E1BF3|nr:pyridoxal-phosphate dependent enzyme [Halanaeroarchaeum sp. HSR-CO]UWG46665.1 Threonine synthase and cysteate synthase [Halanaeroarchaeum sp. HSR-CO]
MAASLVCPDCGETYDAGPGEPWQCTCGHPLDFAERPLPDGPPETLGVARGLWAFEDFLPIEPHVTLGEGWTPLADAPAWDATFKLEYVLPSGSFKDRGATATLSRAVELGVDRVVEDSSGNAGAAIAQYAARAGVEADIYVPAGAKESKLKAIRRVGATPVPIEGTRQDVTDACVAAVEAGDAWYASHAWNPAFFAGTATFAVELAAQRDWSVPDAVVVPLGHGTLFLGAYRGFTALRDAGWTDSVPRLLGVQAAGVAPIAAALNEDADGPINDVADGIQITDPVRQKQILDAVDDTGGDAIAIGEAATEAALTALHERGFYVEPTSAIAVAGLEAYRERGVLSTDDDVVVPLTGSGLKY